MYFKPYRYVKEPFPEDVLGEKMSFLGQTLPLVFIVCGSLIISTQAVLPFLSFPTQNAFLVRPVKTFHVLGASRDGGLVGFENLREVTDGGESPEEEVPPVFFLSVPALGIEKAKVRKDTTEQDPRTFLGHLMGSALPGETGGAIFIYGHSTFPWLFDPENYLTVFSTLPKLERGDEVFIEYPGRKWVYRVEGFKTLDPEGVNPYSFGGNECTPSRLVLMTCVPPGTLLRRFFVLASFVCEGVDCSG